MESNNIGKRIAQLRKEKGWSQTELAEKLNVTDKAVSKWERGGMPSVDLFPKLSRIFNVSIDYLMLGDEGSEENESEYGEKKEIPDQDKASFSIEELSIEDIELILSDQRDLYTEEELCLLELRLEELSSEDTSWDALFCPKCGAEITDSSMKFCKYCSCDFSIHSPTQDEDEDYEDYEDDDDYEDYRNRSEGIGCLGYIVAFLFPIIGLIWGIIKDDRGVIIFSIIMTLIEIVVAFALLPIPV